MRTIALSRLNRHLTTCCSAIALLSCAGIAHAQDAQTAQEAAASVDDIVVTASRIDRAGFQAPTPTIHLTAEDLSVGARSNIAAALNDMPQFKASSSPQTTGTNTGAGNAPVDLRGLG
ncbi:MAG: outer membrane receptor protein, partial [Caulobacteraceae bacterium]